MRTKWLSLVVSGAVVAGLATPLTSTATAQAPRKKADLTLTSVTAPARATIGAKATIKVKVKNKGTLKAARSVTAFHLSKDRKVGRDVALKPTKATPKLKPRKTWAGSAAVTIPASTTPGRYYVVACADAGRKVREKTEGNNCRVSGAVFVDEPPSSHELIDEAVKSGELTEEQGLTYKVFSDFKDPRLPAKYSGGDPDALEEGALSTAADSWPDLSAQTQATLRPFLIPPFYAGSHWSPDPADGGRTVAASDAPWCSGTGGSTPLFEDWDFLDVPGGQYRIWWLKGNAADAAQAAHMSNLIATTILPELTALMGRGPMADDGGFCDGGTGATDIALLDASTAQVHGDGFLCGDGVSSHMVWPRTKPAAWAGSDPYLAHEIMHTIQFGFPQDGFCGDYKWLREMTAQWVQDYVTDPAYGIGLGPDDTEFEAVPHFMNATNTSLDDADPIEHAYGAYLLAQWGAHNLSKAWIRDIWDNVAGMDATHAVNTALQGSGFVDVWADFALSNWNQGPVKHYQQWDNMTKSVRTVGPEPIPPAKPRNPSIEVNHLAAQYLELAIDPKVDELEILNDKAGDTYAKLRAVVSYSDGTYKVVDLNQPKNYLCINDGTKRATHVVLIFSNSHMEDETTFAPTLTGKVACACPNSTTQPRGRAVAADGVCVGDGNITFSTEHEVTDYNDDGTVFIHSVNTVSGSLNLKLTPDPEDPDVYRPDPTSTYTVQRGYDSESFRYAPNGCGDETLDIVEQGAGSLGPETTFTAFDPDSDILWLFNAILMPTEMESLHHVQCVGDFPESGSDHVVTPECPPTPEGGNIWYEFEPVAPGSSTYSYSCTGEREYEDGSGVHEVTTTVSGTLTLPE